MQLRREAFETSGTPLVSTEYSLQRASTAPSPRTGMSRRPPKPGPQAWFAGPWLAGRPRQGGKPTEDVDLLVRLTTVRR